MKNSSLLIPLIAAGALVAGCKDRNTTPPANDDSAMPASPSGDATTTPPDTAAPPPADSTMPPADSTTPPPDSTTPPSDTTQPSNPPPQQ